VSFLAPYGSVPYNDRRLLVDPETSTFVQFRALDYGMENCSLALGIPSFDDDSVAVDIAHIGSLSTIDVWALAVDRKVDLRRLSFNTLPRRLSKVGTFTPKYNTTERLPDFRCDSGTYYAFLLACPQGAGKEDCRVDMTSTKEELIGIFMEQRQTI